MADQDAPVAPGRARKVTYRQAALILAERDPVVAALIEQAGLPRFPAPTEDNFATLVRSVVYQQLAGAAARAIHGRLIAALGEEVTPERILATPGPELKAVGLSARKVESLQDLSAKVLDGTVVLDARRLARVSDDEIVARLSTVRGIGKWSAEIFLMFQLRRMDVWPTGDLAIRAAFKRLYNKRRDPSPESLIRHAKRWQPYRSVASWYLWRSLDTEL